MEKAEEGLGQGRTIQAKATAYAKQRAIRGARCMSGLEHRVLGNGTGMGGRAGLGVKHSQLRAE